MRPQNIGHLKPLCPTSPCAPVSSHSSLLCLWAALMASQGGESLLLICQVCCWGFEVGVKLGHVSWRPWGVFFKWEKHIPWESNSYDLKQFGQ